MEPEFTRNGEPGYERCRQIQALIVVTRRLTLQAYHEGLLLLHGLEASVTKLGGGVDELEVDLLQRTTAGLNQQRLKTKQVHLEESTRTPTAASSRAARS